MGDRSSTRRATRGKSPKRAANDDVSLSAGPEAVLTQAGAPANDNPPFDDLPACLAVTDDEVRLLHRYLGDQILALFR
jgi:hypothetical protein